jgi:hypothetical protein
MFRAGLSVLVIGFSAAGDPQGAAPAQLSNNASEAQSFPKSGCFRDLCVEVQRSIDATFPDRVVSGEADLVMAIRQGIETSPTFRRLIETDAEPLLREMIVQDHFYLEVAGLLGLQRVRPEAVAEATALVFLKGKHIGVAATSVSGSAMNVMGTREYMDALAEQLRNRRFEAVGQSAIEQAIIGGRLSATMIDEWYNDSTRRRLPISFEAFLWGFAADARQQTATELSPRMKKELEDFAKAPGFPQIVFALHADEDDPRLEEALRSALAFDTGSPDAQESATSILLLVRRGDYIRKHIDIDEINMPASRRKLVQQLMDKAKPDTKTP